MNALSRPLDFGPEEHFRILHGTHRLPVFVAVDQSQWMEQRIEHDVASFVVDTLANSGSDCYLTANAYQQFTPHRSVSSVAQLCSAFVDLDYYKIPQLRGLTAQAVLDRVMKLHPALPMPTLLTSSGRGAWLHWKFSHGLGAKYLPRWQRLERDLVTLLKPFGADPSATDAARMGRIVGSMNSRSGQRVQSSQVGSMISLAELEQAVRRMAPKPEPVITWTPKHGKPGKLVRGRTGKPRGLRAYVLHADRLADLRTLIKLRGGRLTDGRRRTMYVAAISFAWYCPSPDAMTRELMAFSADCFADPERYGPSAVNAVIKRMAQDQPLAGHLYVDPQRYRMRSRTIIDLLEITPAEQREMQTLISPEEKARRRAEKRQAMGGLARDMVAARTAQRTAEARRMRAEGITQGAIAAALGISQPAVSKLLRRA